MLPTSYSSSSSSRRSYPYPNALSYSSSSSSSGTSRFNLASMSGALTLTHLRARTRLTNLAVFLISSLLALSLLLNLSHHLSSGSGSGLYTSTDTSSYTKPRWKPWFSTGRVAGQSANGIDVRNPLFQGWADYSLAGAVDEGATMPPSIDTTINRDPRMMSLKKLIMVPGHAIWLGSPRPIAAGLSRRSLYPELAMGEGSGNGKGNGTGSGSGAENGDQVVLETERSHDTVEETPTTLDTGSEKSAMHRRSVEDDDEWILEPMQRGKSVKTFLKHIREGVERAKAEESSLLVFSGGATRPPPAPALSEGQSYLSLALALSLIPESPIPPVHSSTDQLPLNARVTTEEFALDSYENLLFSIARFKEVTGRWPEEIMVVGYGMKRRRFEELHARAIGWPEGKFEYVGIDDEGDTTEHYAGELKYGFTPFLTSPSGCHPPLSTKRQLRNPFSKFHPYHTSNPELSELLEWCPRARASHEVVDDPSGMEVFAGQVPWRSSSGQGAGVNGKAGKGERVYWDRERD